MATLSWPTVYTGAKRKTYTGTAEPELQLINSLYTLRAVKRVLVCLHKELGLGAQAVNHGNRGGSQPGRIFEGRTGWTKSMGPRVQGHPSSGQKIIFDLPDNADIVLSPAQNLQVITIHNYLCCMGVLCTWVKLLTDFGL